MLHSRSNASSVIFDIDSPPGTPGLHHNHEGPPSRILPESEL
jgi:hypothetical protein